MVVVMPALARGPLAGEVPPAVSRHEERGAPPLRQLPLFAGISPSRPEHDTPEAGAAEPAAEAPDTTTDDRQLDLFGDRAILFRELDAALASGSFDEASCLRARIEECFGPEATRSLAPLDWLAGVAWEGPPETPLEVWAQVDRQLAGQPQLRDRVRGGVFTRLLRSHGREELLAARPDFLPALAHAVRFHLGRSPEEGRREARALVRDSLLAGRALEALDFRDDAALADLLAEGLEPRWLACLGRIRRLWPSSPLCASELEGLAEVARCASEGEDPAMVFGQCLRVAESPDTADELRQQARRRMKQLHPELHALFMRHAPGSGAR